MGREVEVGEFVRDVIKASIFAEPKEPGLSPPEVHELGRQFGFGKGELDDALGPWMKKFWSERLLPDAGIRLYSDLSGHQDDPRDLKAIQLVFDEFEQTKRELGRDRAHIDRRVLEERLLRKGFSEHIAQSTVTFLVLSAMLRERDDGVLEGVNILKHACPNVEFGEGRTRKAPAFARYVGAVRQVTSRRGVSPSASEPEAAFEASLEKLGASELRTWWRVTHGELRGADSNASPMSFAVLSASMVECALTVVAEHVKRTDPSAALKGDKWSLDQLNKWARKTTWGRAIFDDELGRLCTRLNEHRQRIHPGRFLGRSDAPQLADIRPEEGRECRATLQRCLRAVLDWYNANNRP